MRAPKTLRLAHLNQLALPLLLLISACNADNSISPAAPDAAAPLEDTELSKHNCFSHHNDCASPKNGRIAFSRYISYTGFAIYSANPDGTDYQQLSTPIPGVHDDYSPDWSPDGSMIVFERDYTADGTHQFFRANANGSGLTQLTFCTGLCLGVANPAYSPDGRRIAFAEAYGDETALTVGIWIMNADGSNPVQVTQRRLGTGSTDQWAAWSPDGRRIAFTRINDVAEPANRQAIFVSNADGSDARRITPWQLNATEPDWSPDGRLIIVTSHYDIEPLGKEQLYTVHPDGSHITLLTPSGLSGPSNIGGKFSPDGRKIVFQHDAGTGDDRDSLIYTMDLDGSHVLKLSQDRQFYAYAAWGTHR